MSQIEISLNQIGKSGTNQRASENSVETLVTPTTKRVGITTMGCKVNTYESELIGETLRTDDWQLVPNTHEADLYLINTCTVTKEADRQARQEVRKAVKRNPDALVVVTGCYAQMDPDACAAIPGVDLVLGNDKKLDAHSLMPQLQRGELPKVLVGDLDQHVSLPDQLLTGFEAHTRAFVQIQQGCDQGCTFCIIHVARGPSRSLAPTLIKRQVQRLVLNGYPEVVICGVDLGSYGEDFNTAPSAQTSPADFDSLHDETGQSYNLVKLIKELLKLEHDADNPFRIRLSSIDPHHISDELIELMATQKRICPQFHLSLQSGNTLILKRMKRRYDADKVRERILALRSKMPELVMSADVMVGFPTESNEQFEDTLAMVEELDIAYPHVFSYSERDGTPAARIPQAKQVAHTERKQRNSRVRELGKALKTSLMKRSLGKEMWVLAEKPSKHLSGFTVCRAENYLEMLVKSTDIAVGIWTKARLESIENDVLFAEIVFKP